MDMATYACARGHFGNCHHSLVPRRKINCPKPAGRQCDRHHRCSPGRRGRASDGPRILRARLRAHSDTKVKDAPFALRPILKTPPGPSDPPLKVAPFQFPAMNTWFLPGGVDRSVKTPLLKFWARVTVTHELLTVMSAPLALPPTASVPFPVTVMVWPLMLPLTVCVPPSTRV